MKERPILFSGAMVSALLEGRKTQTRRVVKPQPEVRNAGGVAYMPTFKHRHGTDRWLWPNAREQILAECPYGNPGDRLWVRETWVVQRHEPCLPHERDYQDLHSPVIRYLADGACRCIQSNHATGEGIYHGAVEKPRPSIFMPRWASRITLEITDVHAERVRDISAQDALAEGIHRIDHGREGYFYHAARTEPHHNNWCDPVDAFGELWEAINGLRGFGWNANPWVWALTFKRVERMQRAYESATK